MDPFHDVERARGWLRRTPPSSRTVHEARKSLRRARAVLRLGRGTAVAADCARAASACRRAARALAAVRDDRVFADTLARLVSRRGEGLPPEAFARGRALALRARRAEARALCRGASLRRARAALGACPRGPGPGGFARAVAPALAERLAKAYRRGRRDYRAARACPQKDRLHDLRKDSKMLLHELEEAAPRAPAIVDLRRLGGILGEEHDLTLLRARLPRSADAAALRRLARRRRRRLRRRALTLAKGLFSRRGPGDSRARARLDRLVRQGGHAGVPH